MTDIIADTLVALSIESGEMEAPVVPAEITLPDVLANELVVAQEPSLADAINQAEVADAVADQLEDIAVRADAVPTDDVAVVALSAESLNREFETVMRANGLTLKSHSFEAAGSDEARLKGVAKDARLYADFSRKAASAEMDISNEGKILRFLRADQTRINAAKTAMTSELAKVSAKLGDLDKHGVAFSHSALAKFLTQNNKPVTNIKAAIDADAAWLDKVRAAVDSVTGKVISALNQIKGGTAPNLDSDKLLAPIAGLATTNLLGNYAVSSTGEDGGKFKFKRVLNKNKATAYDMGHGALMGIGFGLISVSTFGAGAAVAAGVGAAGAVLGTKLVKGARTSSKELYSASSGAELRGAVATAQSLEKHIDFKVDWEALDAAWVAAEDADHGENKAAIATALKEIEVATNAIVKLADVAYEQAIYDLIQMANVLKAVSSHMGSATIDTKFQVK